MDPSHVDTLHVVANAFAWGMVARGAVFAIQYINYFKQFDHWVNTPNAVSNEQPPEFNPASPFWAVAGSVLTLPLATVALRNGLDVCGPFSLLPGFAVAHSAIWFLAERMRRGR